MKLSECCDAPRWGDFESDICQKCKEHAEFYDEDDRSCPKCRGDSVIWCHQKGTFAVPECDYWQCESCGFQWGHE